MLPLLKTEIKTPKSFLNIYSFENDELLNNCISDIKDKYDDYLMSMWEGSNDF